MCLGPRSYRTDSAPRLHLPLLSSPPPTPLNLPPPERSHSIRTLNEGCNAENTLAFNNQGAFSSQQLLSSQGCLPISHIVCVLLLFFFLSYPPASATEGKANVASCLTNTRRYTHSGFDSIEPTRGAKQKKKKWPCLLQIKNWWDGEKNSSHLQSKRNKAHSCFLQSETIPSLSDEIHCN